MMLNHKQVQIKFKPVYDGLRSCTFKALFMKLGDPPD